MNMVSRRLDFARVVRVPAARRPGGGGLGGIAAGILNIIPYFGAMAVGVATAVAAFTQFGTMTMVIVVPGTSARDHRARGMTPVAG